MLRLYNNTHENTKNSFTEIIQNIDIPKFIFDKIHTLLYWYGSLRSCNKYEIITGCIFIALKNEIPNLNKEIFIDLILKNGIQFSLANINYVIMFITQFPVDLVINYNV